MDTAGSSAPGLTLVLGARGYIGGQVVSALSNSDERVLAVTRHGELPEYAPHTPVQWVLANPDHDGVLEKLIEKHSVRRVVDAAWLGASSQLMADPDNELAAESMLKRWKRFRNAGVQQWVGFGSCAEYAWDGHDPLSEKSLLLPATPYGRAKMRVYRDVILAGPDQTMRCAWLRPFFIYGGRDHPHRLLPSLISAAQSRQPHGLREPERRLDFIRVQDVAQVVADLLGREFHGALNVGSGAAVRVGDVAHWVQSVVQGDAGANTHSVQCNGQEPGAVVADTQLLRTLLGWQPAAISREHVRLAVSEYLGAV